MKALVATAFDGPDSLQLQDMPEPVAQSGEVLVKVEAVGVNFADVMSAKGQYAGGPKPPFISGREFSGRRVDNGERVMGYAQHSAGAELISAGSDLLWPAPEAWTAVQAAAFPVNYLTAWLLYWKAGLIPGLGSPDGCPIGTGKRVLIHAAAGGVGTAAVQLGKLLGIETFGTASSEEKIAKLVTLGLDHPINYKVDDYEQKIKELTNGEGVDAAFDSLGGVHTAKSLGCCAFLGRVIIFGTATGEKPKFSTMSMYSKGASVHGFWLSKLAKNPKLIALALDSMKPLIDSGKLAPVIGATYPLAQGAAAHRLLIARKNFGKVVLTLV